MSLKQKTISGYTWAFAERFGYWIIQFVFGIILSRLLSPTEYGLIAMIVIFLDIADTLVISGYGEALIRKKAPSNDDYSTVFLSNLTTAILCYAGIFLIAPSISSFFEEPVLEEIIAVIGIIIIINSFTLVPRVQLKRKLDFKSLTKESFFSNGISGLVAITLAFMGYGVWSLVWKNIVKSIASTFILFSIVKPKFSARFNIDSFREIFGFGSKLIATRLINVLYANSFNFIIGKFFSVQDLGLYNKANGFNNMFSRTLTKTLKSVSFPVLSKVKDEQIRLKAYYKKLFQTTTYLTFLLTFGLAAVADNFILGLIGPKWEEAIIYLQLLCFVGLFRPLASLNLNILVVKGRSDLNLTLEVLRKIIAIPVIVLGVFKGIKIMIIGLIGVAVIDFVIVAIWSGKFINYSLKEQLSDISPSFYLAIAIGASVFVLGKLIPAHPLLMLVIQSTVGLILTIAGSEFFSIKPYLIIKEIISEKLGLRLSLYK